MVLENQVACLLRCLVPFVDDRMPDNKLVGVFEVDQNVLAASDFPIDHNLKNEKKIRNGK